MVGRASKNAAGLPGHTGGQEPACQYRRRGFDPCVRNIPWRRAWQPPPVFLAWRIPRMEEPGGLQFMELLKSQTRFWQLSTHAEGEPWVSFPAHLCIKNVILFFSSFPFFTVTRTSHLYILEHVYDRAVFVGSHGFLQPVFTVSQHLYFDQRLVQGWFSFLFFLGGGVSSVFSFFFFPSFTTVGSKLPGL